MNNETKIKPDIRIVPINESEYWDEEAIRIGGQIALVFVFDANVVTYLCSLTPSYWLRYVDFITEKMIEDDYDYDYIRDGINQSEQSNYYGRSVAEAKYISSVVDNEDPDFPGYDDQELYDEWFNDIVESLQCNQSVFELDCFEILGWKS